jgi:hypothetical protein
MTVLCAMNAAGGFVPPMLIFKRKRMTDILLRGAPLVLSVLAVQTVG